MKTETFMTVLPAFLFFVAAASLAYKGGDENWNTDGLNGGLRVNVTLLASPCSLSAESAEQEVSLGTIPQWMLSGSRKHSDFIPVHLILEDCLAGSVIRDHVHGNNLSWFPDQQIVMMNIIGDEDPFDHRLYRLHGASRGAAISLEENSHMVIPGETSWPLILNPGRNDLTLNARVVRTADILEPGDFRAVVNIGLEYQ